MAHDRPSATSSSTRTLTDSERYRLQRQASKSRFLAIVLGIFLPPVAYVYVGRWGLAFLNLITLNFFLAGFLIVPLHADETIAAARRRLDTDSPA